MVDVWDLGEDQPKVEVSIKGQVFTLDPEPDLRTAMFFQEITRLADLRDDHRAVFREETQGIQLPEIPVDGNGEEDDSNVEYPPEYLAALRKLRKGLRTADRDLEEVGVKLIDRVFGEGQHQRWVDSGMKKRELDRVLQNLLDLWRDPDEDDGSDNDDGDGGGGAGGSDPKG